MAGNLRGGYWRRQRKVTYLIRVRGYPLKSCGSARTSGSPNLPSRPPGTTRLRLPALARLKQILYARRRTGRPVGGFWHAPPPVHRRHHGARGPARAEGRFRRPRGRARCLHGARLGCREDPPRRRRRVPRAPHRGTRNREAAPRPIHRDADGLLKDGEGRRDKAKGEGSAKGEGTKRRAKRRQRAKGKSEGRRGGEGRRDRAKGEGSAKGEGTKRRAKGRRRAKGEVGDRTPFALRLIPSPFPSPASPLTHPSPFTIRPSPFTNPLTPHLSPLTPRRSITAHASIGTMISWCPVISYPLPPSSVGRSTTFTRGR